MTEIRMSQKLEGYPIPFLPLNSKQITTLIIIGVLAGSVALSYGIRAQPLQYAMELDEFDPYFNYRATQYLYDNGWQSYISWNDELSWYPNGRDVSGTSQNMLHITAAGLYNLVAWSGMTLYDFTIYLPAVIGSLTVIPVFLFVRMLTNPRVGLLAGFFFAVSIPFIQRGTAGWFKSEPLGFFYGMIALYLFVSGIRMMQQEDKVWGLLKFAGAGALLTFAISSWGGGIFFLMPIVIWTLMLPIVYKEKFNTGATFFGLISFIAPLYVISFSFDRASGLLNGFTTVAMLTAAVYILFDAYFNTRRGWGHKKTLFIFLALIAILGFVGIIAYQWEQDDGTETGIGLRLVNERYLAVLIPWYQTGSTLTESVAEHRTPEFGHIFERTVFLMLFAPIGVLAMIRRKIPAPTASLVLIISGIGLWVGTGYVRLELFMSFAFIMLASIGLYYLFNLFTERNNVRKKKAEKFMGKVLIIMLLAVTIFPAVLNWSIMMDRPPLIATGATFGGETDAWFEATDWLKSNTDPDSVVLAWWDYGYWIETKAERATVMDNAAFGESQISDYARILTGSPETAADELRERGVNYVVTFWGGMKHPESSSYAVMGGLGTDLAKMSWIMKIGGTDPSLYYDDKSKLTTDFYTNTFYGKMIPFTPLVDSNPIEPNAFNPVAFPWQNEINPENGELWEYGWSYYDPLKTEGIPGMRLVYVSSEFERPRVENTMNGIFKVVAIYEVIPQVDPFNRPAAVFNP